MSVFKAFSIDLNMKFSYYKIVTTSTKIEKTYNSRDDGEDIARIEARLGYRQRYRKHQFFFGGVVAGAILRYRSIIGLFFSSFASKLRNVK